MTQSADRNFGISYHVLQLISWDGLLLKVERVLRRLINVGIVTIALCICMFSLVCVCVCVAMAMISPLCATNQRC